VGIDDRAYTALPKLYGAPAYARPPAVAVQRTQRPFDPDDLPLEAELRLEERGPVGEIAAGPSDVEVAAAQATVAPPSAAGNGLPLLPGRPFRLRGLAGRLTGGKPAGPGEGG
jgi:hypothetical protein